MKYVILVLGLQCGCIAPPPGSHTQPDLGPDLHDDDRVDMGFTSDMKAEGEVPDANGRDEDLAARPVPTTQNPWPDGREPDIGVSDGSEEEDTNIDENGRPKD